MEIATLSSIFTTAPSVPVRKIWQEYQESYKSIPARLVFLQEKDHLSSILQDLAKIWQESCVCILTSFLQDPEKCETNGPFLALQVLQGYSCNILDTPVRFFTGSDNSEVYPPYRRTGYPWLWYVRTYSLSVRSSSPFRKDSYSCTCVDGT